MYLRLFIFFYRPVELLGELQFCFVCFLVGYCLEGLEQWQRLVRLLCHCHSAVCHRTQLYSQLLDVIDVQLAEVPQDFLVDIVASENVIYRSLRYALIDYNSYPHTSILRVFTGELLLSQVSRKKYWSNKSNLKHLKIELRNTV